MINNLCVQLVGDTKIKGSIFAIDQTLAQIKPECVQFLTSKDVVSWRPEVEIVKIPPLTSGFAYNSFMIRELHKYMPLPHTLVIQWDGYVLDGTKWNDEFMKYDYIGGPFFAAHSWYRVPMAIGKPVMNGGFSMRSKRLQVELANEAHRFPHPEEAHVPLYEDQYITRIWRNELEAAGMNFAPWELAETFSVEGGPYTGQLGWHGTGYGPQFIHGKIIADPP